MTYENMILKQRHRSQLSHHHLANDVTMRETIVQTALEIIIKLRWTANKKKMRLYIVVCYVRNVVWTLISISFSDEFDFNTLKNTDDDVI